MRRRTGFVGTVTLVAVLATLPADATTVGTDDPALDPAAVAATVERQVGDRYGGYWVEREDGDDVVHVNVVEPTAADRRAAPTDNVRLHEADHSYDQLMAARDAVAASLDRERTGNYAVSPDVRDNGLTVETERGDAAVTRLMALAALRQAAVTPAGDPGSGISLERLRVLRGSDIGVVPLGGTPTTFPPYEAGLHLRVASGTTVIRCTSAFSFSRDGDTYGSTAGHCGGRGTTVRVDHATVGQVSINTFEAASPVRADTALYPLSAGGWDHETVIHGNPTHRRVTGSLADSQIGNGMRLCFDGRASGVGNCGTVDAAGRLVCCDSGGKSFVFSCIDQPAQAGDSGGPVYQAQGTDRAVAAGTLSSSVTIDGRRSMCFSTIDQIEQATGTTVDTG